MDTLTNYIFRFELSNINLETLSLNSELVDLTLNSDIVSINSELSAIFLI